MYDDFPSGMRSYLKAYGWHFSKAMCDWAVSMMEKEDGNGKKVKITPFTKEQVDEMLKKYSVDVKKKGGYDYVYAANMCKADYLGSSVPNEQYAALYVKNVCDDPDAYDGIVFTRFYADCIGSGNAYNLGGDDVMGGWGYILRILKGESPKDVLASMPDKDFDKVSEVVGNLKATNLTRQQRRRIEREFKTVRR